MWCVMSVCVVCGCVHVWCVMSVCVVCGCVYVWCVMRVYAHASIHKGTIWATVASVLDDS